MVGRMALNHVVYVRIVVPEQSLISTLLSAINSNIKKNMKSIDLAQALKPYTEGWVAINKRNKKVVAHAKTFELITQKIKDAKDIILVPASKNYFGFVTYLNA